MKWRRREDIIGKEVIDSNAKKVGVSKDLAWSDDGKLALILQLGGDEDAFLSFDDIERIGDVVFIKAQTSPQTIPTVTCPVCKAKNPKEAKFCARCGRTLEGKD